MSKKLYKVIEAVDLFDENGSIPERYLLFMDSDGNQIKKFFPKYRTTLFFEGELYDWYGHKVMLGSSIAKIIKPFGYFGNSSDNPKEQFLVTRYGGKCLALATLCRHEEKTCLSNTLENYKHNLLHRNYASTQMLKPLDWSFRELVDLSSTCFGKYFMCANEYTIFAGVDDYISEKNRPLVTEYVRHANTGSLFPSTWFARGHTYDRLLEHRVVEDRGRALMHFAKTGYIYANYLIGNLVISNHGEKITATFPVPDKNGNNRISTDSDVIKLHCATSTDCLYWYYDPEP